MNFGWISTGIHNETRKISKKPHFVNFFRDELLATQQHLQEFSLKVNENKEYHQQATDIYKERIQQLETPTKLPLPFLSCPTLNELRTAIAEFGEVKECKLDYSLKKQPVLAVGKYGSNDNELNATGLALDEINQLIYIADRVNKRISSRVF